MSANAQNRNMKIAIIGAGAAGLAALKRCLEASTPYLPIEPVVFEKTDQIGGTWVYVPETGNDAYGLPIHSSMYNSLRTNLPKEVMGYPDFFVPENPQNRSYVTRSEILSFLEKFAEENKLHGHIKFHHLVELIEPASHFSWNIRVRDLKEKTTETLLFSAVMVCNGHYFEPMMPSIKGSEKFQGQILHSHDYRVPEPFTDKKIVVVGAGPSGMDLALELSRKARYVILSHHLKEEILTRFPDNVSQRPDIAEIDEKLVYFSDQTEADVDVILFCTGYKYSFPFLSSKVLVEVDNNMVTPLWKQIVACHHPTLAFIGLPFYVCAFSMFDLQARFVLQYWSHKAILPDRNAMLAEHACEKKFRLESRNWPKRHFHMMGPLQGEYYDDLAITAGITSLVPVLTDIHNHSSKRFMQDLANYRNDKYRILDAYQFWTDGVLRNENP